MDNKVFSTLNEFDLLFKDTTEALLVLPKVVQAYIQTLQGYDECRVKWKRAVEEVGVLSTQLSAANNEIADLRLQVHNARKLVEEEQKKRQHAEKDRDYFETQLEQLRGILKDNKNNLSELVEKKFSNLKKKGPKKDVYEQNVDEFETTGSVMADLSYTRDEEGLLDIPSTEARVRKRARAAIVNKEKKKRRSSSASRACELELKNPQHYLIATTTMTVDDRSKIHASSVLESKPKIDSTDLPYLSSISEESDIQQPSTSKANYHQTSSNKTKGMQHNFQQKAMLKGEICDICSKRIEFSSLGYKCQDCKIVCHINCRDNATIPCVLNRSTPCKKSAVSIADYTSSSSPMIPPLVFHCIKEVEERGLKTVGLYLIPGSDKEAKELKEKFLCGKGVPYLSRIQDIHVICSCLKEFFSSLKDPLTTKARREDLGSAVEIEDPEERRLRVCEIVSGLPQPNRDTLAFLILHLKVVNESPDCKMPNSNLANAFGPIIIGYSDPENVYEETNTVNKIMTELLEIPKNYWESFISESSSSNAGSYDCFSPKRNKILRRMRFFDSP